MAYVANDEDDDLKNQASPSTSTGPVSPGGANGVQLSTPSGVGTGAAGSSATTAQPKGAGGQFGSLNDYLTANQGQAQPLANKVTSGIQSQYNDLDAQNNQTISNLNSSVQNAPGYAANNTGLLTQEAADPTSFASDAGNVKNFQSLLNDNYSGPTSAESDAGYQTQQANINNAISEGQAATQTPAGQQQLIAQSAATPTAGVNALNSAILSQDPTALGQVQDAYQPFNNLLTGLSSGAAGVDQTIANEQAQATAANTASNAALNGQVTGLNNTVGNEVTADQTNQNAYNTALGTVQTAANTANSDIQNYLSSTPQLQGVSTSALSPYLNLTALSGAPTAATAANTGDYALQNALQTLEGSTPLQTAINQSTVGQAGTALPANFNSLLTQLGGLPTAVQNAVGGIGTQINNDYAPLGTVEAQRAAQNAEQAALPTQLKGITADQTAVSNAQAAMNNQLHGGAAQATPAQTAALAAAQQKLATDTAAYKAAAGTANANGQAEAQQAYNLAQGDQWIPTAATNYNSLLNTLNSSLAPIGNINLSGITNPNQASGTALSSTPQGQSEAGKIGSGIGTVAGGIIGGIYGGPAGAAGGASIGGTLGAPAGEGAYNSIAQLSSDISNPKLDTTGLDIATGGISIGLEQGLNAVVNFFKNLF